MATLQKLETQTAIENMIRMQSEKRRISGLFDSTSAINTMENYEMTDMLSFRSVQRKKAHDTIPNVFNVRKEDYERRYF